MKVRKIFFITGIILIFFALAYWYSVTESFNETNWKSPDSVFKSSLTRSDRQKMLRDVLKNIKGKSKAEVVLMLGEGSKVGYFRYLKYDLIYLLGPERGFFGIDSEWLLIWFDENEIFKRYEMATD